MPQADPGNCRQLGDAPWTAGLAQHDAQDLSRLWPKQRLEFALFRHRFVRHHALDEHPAKGDPGVALQVEIADVHLFAQPPHRG
ncbi:hypothetical protein D3C85_1647150 [compost metagenome]